jgi:hypothetical protein
VHLLLLVVLYACMAAACAWAYRAAPVFGAIVTAGTAIRLVVGVGLVAISYYRWPILQPLQTGDGYWAIAPDARVYFQLAADAARLPPGSIIGGSPSPTYVLALSLWFRVLGATVTNGVVFNVACYVVAAMVIVRLATDRQRQLGIIALCCVSFSPALVLTSTQVLKDAFFAMLIVVGCASAIVVLRAAGHSLSAQPGRVAIGVALTAAAVAAMAGVRAYFALFVWLAVAGGLVAAVWTADSARRVRVAGFAASMLVVLWCAFAVGADAYYTYYQELIARTTGINLSMRALLPSGGAPISTAGGSALGERLNSLRDGFLGSGGATNFGTRHGRGPNRTIGDITEDLATGIAATFIPIFVLRRVGVIDFDGGRGLLTITDLDTLFIDAMLVAIVIAIFRTHALTRDTAGSLIFIVALAMIALLVIAYVVTNFGTLVRLRLLFAIPAFLAPIALKTTT